MSVFHLEELNIIEQSGFREKIKEKGDYIKLDYNFDYQPILSLVLEFGYVISISGLGEWGFIKKKFDFLGFIGERSRDYDFNILESYINDIKRGNNKYKITIYISPTKLDNYKNKKMEDKKYVIDDFINKIYRYFDIELDKSNILVDYSGTFR